MGRFSQTTGTARQRNRQGSSLQRTEDADHGLKWKVYGDDIPVLDHYELHGANNEHLASINQKDYTPRHSQIAEYEIGYSDKIAKGTDDADTLEEAKKLFLTLIILFDAWERFKRVGSQNTKSWMRKGA